MCRGASNKYISLTRVGAPRTPQYCPYKGVSVLSGGSFLEQVSLGVVHADNLVDPSNEGGDLDIHPWHVFSPTPEAPRHKACVIMLIKFICRQNIYLGKDL